jgi:alpha-ketoglutarate-dependent taurine dioxygenase
MRILFSCVVAARTGGATPLLDCRSLLGELGPDIVDGFEAKGLSYIRNFSKGIDVAWQDFFATADRDEVKIRCARSGTACEWLADGTLRIRQPAAAVRVHPVSGERTFFNQVLLHHPAALPAEVRAAMDELYEPEAFPRNVTYGDGSEIADDVVRHLLDVSERRSVSFEWQSGDMVMLDNMLVSHGRAPYSGPRKILVALAGIHHAE